MYFNYRRNLIKLRKEKGISIEELSEKSNVSILIISNIENGITSHHNIDTIAKLAKALDISVDDFIIKKL